MKSFTASVLAAALASTVSAHPGHGAGLVDRELLDRASLNLTTIVLNANASTADDHVPTFQAAKCECPPAVCDSRMNAASICACQAQAKLACYMASTGACPKPDEKACNSAGSS